MKSRSRVLLRLLFASLSLELSSPSRNLLSAIPLSLPYSLPPFAPSFFHPVSSFALFSFVIPRALFSFFFLDASPPPCLCYHISSFFWLFLLHSRSGGFGRCAPLNIWISRIEPHGTAGYGERHVFLYSRSLLPSSLRPDRLSFSVLSRAFLSRFTSWSSLVVFILRTMFRKSNVTLSIGGDCSLYDQHFAVRRSNAFSR